MTTYTFIKQNEKWQIDAPDFIQQGGDQAHLNMVAGANALLNLLSEGKNKVTLTFNTEPFENADVMELLQMCDPFMEGGYYRMNSHKGKEIDYNMWLCDITKFVFGNTPQKIYVRKEAKTSRLVTSNKA